MNSTTLQSNINALRAFVDEHGWHIIDEKPIQSGYQLIISDGKSKIPFDLFHTGKVLIQGKESSLRSELQAWWYSKQSTLPQPVKFPGIQSSLFDTPTMPPTVSFAGTPRIGCDESGKGDYFGPLVIAAAYVDAQSEVRLQEMGVRDSKLLTDNRILKLAGEIKVLCPQIVVPVDPKRYNSLYAQIENLNRLLAWGHAWTLEQLLDKVPARLAIIDQFADPSYISKTLLEKGRRIIIEQRPRAEEDIAVAAASILARARFVQFMEQLSKSVGEELPKGSSDPSIITVGRRIVASEGKEKLAEIAKLHFRTTEMILQG